MTNKLFRLNVIKFIAVFFFLALGSIAAQAQTCPDRLARATAAIEGLQAEIRQHEQNDIAQQRQIDLRDQKIEKQQERIDAQQEKIDALNSKIEQLQRQAALLEENVRLTQQNAQSQQTIAAINAQFIAVQQEAIKALVKTSRRSALEKAIEALPSIAGIIALAIAK